jgi:nitrogen fixation/metabolism regulation signal transduction histidine kinase
MDSLPEAFANLGKGLKYLHNAILETKALAKELASGNLSCSLPPPENNIAAPLKSLHMSLKHLTWQTQQVAKGDYSQRVDFMGNFSVAFNYMITQLKQRRKINLDEKTKLETYVRLILENCSNPLLVFDGHGKLVFVSNSWFKYCRLFTEDSIQGRQIYEIFHPVVSEESLNEIKHSYNAAFADKQTYEIEQDIDFGFHETCGHFNIQYTPMLDLEGNADGMMVFLFDLRKR